MMQRKEDIVFVVNPFLWYRNMYPSGILCLSGYLKKNGFDNLILGSQLSAQKIPSMQEREDLIIDSIEQAKPKVVCFSSTHREFEEVVRINKRLRARDPRITTIVGGAQPTYRSTDFLGYGFDFVCIGEGEVTLLEFIQEFFQGTGRWEKINGLAWKKGKDNIFNPARKFMEEAEMNSVEVPPYEKIDKRYFEINIDSIRGLPVRGALLLTSRGCPYSCTFCGCGLIFGKKLRFKNFSNIESEIKFLKEKFDIEGVWIVDDTFTVNKEHAVGVAKILQQNKVVWGCQSRVDTINEGLMKAMKDCGCVQIDFGVESGSQRILDNVMKKRTNISQIMEAFRLAKKYKIRTLANFMIGLPSETLDDFRETESIADKINADAYIFAITTPLPGTELFSMINEKIEPFEYSLLDWNGSMLTERLNKSEIQDLIFEKERLYRKYFVKRKNIFSFAYFVFFLNHGHKMERLKFLSKLFAEYMIFRLSCLKRRLIGPNVSKKNVACART